MINFYYQRYFFITFSIWFKDNGFFKYSIIPDFLQFSISYFPSKAEQPIIFIGSKLNYCSIFFISIVA